MLAEEDLINILKRLTLVVVSSDQIFSKNKDRVHPNAGVMISKKNNSPIEASTIRRDISGTMSKSVIADNLKKRDNSLSRRRTLVLKDHSTHN